MSLGRCIEVYRHYCCRLFKAHNRKMGSSLPLDHCLNVWRNADAVCLDVDSTVITGEGLDDLAEYCGCGEAIAKWTLKAMGEGMSFREALEVRLNILKPTKAQLDSFMKTSPPKLTQGVKELCTLLAARNVAVFLISGGFHAIVDHIATELGIPLDRVFANRLLFDSNGSFAGFDKNEPTSESHGKARVVNNLKNTFNFKSLIMIGDGMTDLEAYPPAELFIGFGGNKVRQNVLEKAPWFVYNFQELIQPLRNEEVRES